MSLLRNATPWLAEALPFVDDEGRDGRLLVVKIQYTIGAAGRLEPVAAAPLVYEDRFDGDGPLAPLLRPADVMAPQNATNVLLLGHAYAPRAEGVKVFEPWLGVGPTVFPMRVHAPRRWQSRWLPSRAATLFLLRRFKPVREGRVTRLALDWRHAYGGIDPMRGRVAPKVWPSNPAGHGFHEDTGTVTLKGLPLPAIEDPRQPIRRWQDRRTPQLPGAVSPHWAPRAGLGGTRDARWQAVRAPALPEDGSAAHHNTAHPALQFIPHLKGGEPLHAEGFSADGQAIAFDLPRHDLRAHSYHYGGFAEHRLPLDSVILEPDERRLTLLYRCFVPALQRGFELRRITLEGDAHRAALQP